MTILPCNRHIACPVCVNPLAGISIEDADDTVSYALGFVSERQLLGEHRYHFGEVAGGSSSSTAVGAAQAAAIGIATWNVEHFTDAVAAFERPTLNDQLAIPAADCPECVPETENPTFSTEPCVNPQPFADTDMRGFVPPVVYPENKFNLQDTEGDDLLDSEGQPLLEI